MLVIIGLIVGGVLVGRDLISAAAVRAQISQIEKYNQAVNTFKGKYNYLPGDIADPEASKFGFVARGTWPGLGDGNGIIQGVDNFTGQGNNGSYGNAGEVLVFWRDLSAAGLVDGSFTSIDMTSGVTASGSALSKYIPSAKIGNGNYVYVWSGGIINSYWNSGDGKNYFGLSAVTSLLSGCCNLVSTAGLTAAQAYAIDKKMDDGLPQAGKVLALFQNFNAVQNFPNWAAGGNGTGWNVGYQPSSGPTTATSLTCYDNGGVSGVTQQYSITYNNGLGMNCGLSFQFQ